MRIHMFELLGTKAASHVGLPGYLILRIIQFSRRRHVSVANVRWQTLDGNSTMAYYVRWQ